MKLRFVWAFLLVLGCDGEQLVPCADCAAGGSGGAPPPDTSAIAPVLLPPQASALDCTGSYPLPEALTGPAGLGHHGWELDDLRFTLRWPKQQGFPTRWISDPDAAVPSTRVQPWLAPSATLCMRDSLAPFVGSDRAALLRHAAAFTTRSTGLDALALDTYQPADYPLDAPLATLRAVRGLYELENPLPGAPQVPPWDDALEGWVRHAVEGYPPAVDRALARLVLAVGEAHLAKQQALAAMDLTAAGELHSAFLDEWFASAKVTFASPDGAALDAVRAQGDAFDLAPLALAAQAIASAADELAAASAESGAFESPLLEVLTPHGRILVSTGAADDLYDAARLFDVALLVDLGGNDRYRGRYAASHAFWMGAGVLVDAAGNDAYGDDTPDVESAAASDAFDAGFGFTQGSGLFGVGLLADWAGDDAYTASVYAQGSGAFGVGVLLDGDGRDAYRLAHMGQGAGYFGLGALIDVTGDDDYRLYTVGQGAGKPAGHGLLLDGAGADAYLCYYNDDPPELPSPGYPNHFNLGLSHPYNDGRQAHYTSICQGVGWGYRHDWLDDVTLWSGGSGALLDLGSGNDTHVADVMSMGQGFVYGFGTLYDDGGDDRYRTFWWGPGAAAHMGVGVFFDEAGADDVYVTRASAGFGFDASVGWVVDRGGDDRYGGRMHFGESYTYGMTFFVNEGGDDVYNDGGAHAEALFGIVRGGFEGVNLLGAFLDLGGGNDVYVAPMAGVANDATWYAEPIAPAEGALDPAHHKGIGIDM